MSPGWILIDRCGKHFGTILNYLRDGAVPLPDSRRETEELLAEAKYYLVQGLADECTAALQVPTPHRTVSWYKSFRITGQLTPQKNYWLSFLPKNLSF